MAFMTFIAGAGAAAFMAFMLFIAGAGAAGPLAAASNASRMYAARGLVCFIAFMATGTGMVLDGKGGDVRNVGSHKLPVPKYPHHIYVTHMRMQCTHTHIQCTETVNSSRLRKRTQPYLSLEKRKT